MPPADRHPQPRTRARDARKSTSAEVVIELQDERFAYAGQAVAVSAQGAVIRTSAPLAIGAEVRIHAHSTGRSALARVLSGAREVSLSRMELSSPEYIWDFSAFEPNPSSRTEPTVLQ
jgi:hypothetical protein